MEIRTDADAREYVTDVAYVRNFVPDLAPSRLRLVAALNGFPAPPRGRFDACELGFGTGDTLLPLAAALPNSTFVGVDLNADHVETARGQASRAGLSNVRLLELDFEDLHGAGLQQFDFITAHGVLSWVGPAKRTAILEFASARLKPGGMLYVSYNALPGWAALEPLRRLMLDAASGVQGDSLERARRGLQVAGLLSDAGAAYFTNNPATRSMLETMTRTGLAYVAHEYFHAHWLPMYFADVAREMAASELYFVGQLPAYLNYRDLAVPPSLGALFKDVDNRIEFETLKDFALNEFFRRDVFVKGAIARSEEATRAYFESTAFGGLTLGDAIRSELVLPHYKLQFAGPLYEALMATLERGSATIEQLALAPSLATFAPGSIREALMKLVLGDQVAPMERSTKPRQGAGVRGWHVPLAYNRMVLQQRVTSKEPIVLASPVAGTGIRVSLLQAVCLRLLTEVEPDGRLAWLWAFVASHPLTLHDAERAVTLQAEQVSILSREFDQFCDKRVGEMARLGILQEA